MITRISSMEIVMTISGVIMAIIIEVVNASQGNVFFIKNIQIKISFFSLTHWFPPYVFDSGRYIEIAAVIDLWRMK